MKKFLDSLERYYIKKGNVLSLKDTVPVTLAKQAPAPNGFSYDKSILSLRITELKLSDFGDFDLDASSIEKTEDGLLVSLRLNPQRMHFLCAIDSREDVDTGIDSGGKLSTLEAADDEEKEKWLDQAREQRTRLVGSSTGQQILIKYGEHNDTYEETFRKSSSMRTAWKNGGITKQMCRDTSDAFENSGKINNKTYGSDNNSEHSYNFYAFLEKEAVAINTLFLDPRFDPFDPHSKPPTDGKYYEASIAARGFSQVVGETGNTEDNITPMTPDEVYKHVESPPNADLNMLIEQRREQLHAETLKMMELARPLDKSDLLNENVDKNLNEKSPFEEARINVLNEALAGARRDREREKNAKDVTVMNVEGTAELESITLKARVTSEGVVIDELSIPDFDLEIDSDALAGAAGELVAARFREMKFMHKLLYENLKHSIKQSLSDAIGKAHENKDI